VIRIAGAQTKKSKPHTLPISGELQSMFGKMFHKDEPVFDTAT